MSANIISNRNAEHYLWGDRCDAWYLVKNDDLNIIEERMPPGTAEKRHYHHRARQFFYCIAGTLTIEIEGQDFVLHPGDGVEVAPMQQHQAKNLSNANVRFVVTSQPPSHNDRTDVL